MRFSISKPVFLLSALLTPFFASSCAAPVANGNLSTLNSNSGISNSIVNTNTNAGSPSAGVADSTEIAAREPDQYQAMVKISLQTLAQTGQTAAIPTLGANVARAGNDRVMQFTLPTNEKIIFLDKGGANYLILPNRKQYAELTKEALGFEVRRMMMPEQLVSQAKAIPGMRLVGEETMNGRQVLRYAYQSTANTQTTAGTVGTESTLIVDKQTGLPLRTETVSQSQSGANVQGVNGVRVVTEMTDISTSPDPAMFELPTGFQKIDPETVKAQVNLLFQVAANFIGQAMRQSQPAPATTPSPSPVTQ